MQTELLSTKSPDVLSLLIPAPITQRQLLQCCFYSRLDSSVQNFPEIEFYRMWLAGEGLLY